MIKFDNSDVEYSPRSSPSYMSATHDLPVQLKNEFELDHEINEKFIARVITGFKGKTIKRTNEYTVKVNEKGSEL